MATKTESLKPGDKLRNGSIVIAYSGPREAETCRVHPVVLALIPGNTCTPYVTWRVDPELKETYWGHYHRDLEDAVADLYERASQL